MGCCAPPVSGLLSSALISTVSAPVSQKRQAKPMNFDHRFFDFSNSHWRPHFSYGFAMSSTCHEQIGSMKFWKIGQF